MRYHRLSILIITGSLVAPLLGAARAGDLPGRPAGPPPSVINPREPVPIFLGTPADREAFWNRLSRPDFVIVDGDEYRDLRARLGLAPPGGTRPAQILSVAISGRVVGDQAHLCVEEVINADRVESTWVSVRLEGFTPTRVSEAGHDLPVKQGDDRSWQVEVFGRGEHRLMLQGILPVRGTPESRRVDLAIPPAATTRFELDIPGRIESAATGPNEPIAVGGPVSEGNGPLTHLAAILSPRSRIELTWREQADPERVLPGLATARGEIRVEIDPNQLRTRSLWTVAAVRGPLDHITLRCLPADEVTEVEVDGRSVRFEGRPIEGQILLTIPFDPAIAADQSRQVRIATRRPIAPGNASTLYFAGFPIEEARVQTGTVSVSRAGSVVVSAKPGQGLHRVEPRPEPVGIATATDPVTRPQPVASFEFAAQPFEFHAEVEPESLLVRYEDRTDVSLGLGSTLIQTRWDIRVIQGRPFELAVTMPPGLVFDSAGPAEVVESARVFEDHPVQGLESDRTLVIQLTRTARETGSFRLDLRGRYDLDPDGIESIPLFRPRDIPDPGALIAIRSRRDLTFDLSSSTVGLSAQIRPVRGPAPEGWPWDATGDPVMNVPPSWFRRDPGATNLALRVTNLPTTLHHESLLAVALDRTGASVVEEIDGRVDSGAIDHLDAQLSSQIPARWEVEGVDVVGHDLLAQPAGDSRTVRVRFNRLQTGVFRIRFRYRLGFADPGVKDRATIVRVDPVQLLQGVSAAAHARITTEVGLDTTVNAPGWSTSPAVGPGEFRFDLGLNPAWPDRATPPLPITLALRSVPTARLPGSIASRVWIRTIQRADGDLETSAWYRYETRAGTLTVSLPPGSLWTRASIDGEAIGSEVEVVGTDQYRIHLASDTSAVQALVRIEYVVPAVKAGGPFLPPQLLDDAVVQETAWELQVIGNRVGVGVPSGWTDENEWYREGVVARRRPWKSPEALAAWVAGPDGAAPLAAEVAPISTYGRHGYLFSRVGPPAPMAFRVESRLVLVALCSGPVLLLGLLILARRPPPRPCIAAGLILVFGIGLFGEFNVAVLILQSSSLGLILLGVAIGMQAILGRRRFAAKPAGPPRPAPSVPSLDASPARSVTQIPEGSTAIQRPGAVSPPAPPTPSPPAPSTATLAQP